MRLRVFAFLVCLAACTFADDKSQPKASIVGLDRIWDRAPHNAFTDLALYRSRWYCVFREGSAHASPDGSIRVLTSGDAETWTSASQIRMPGADLRDPKIIVTPSSRLMLTAAAAYPAGSPVTHQTFAWTSTDGRSWTEPAKIGEANFWLWRLAWRRDFLYAPAYSTTRDGFLRLYLSRDGWSFDIHAPDIYHSGSPSEAALLFNEDENALCLVRRDGAQPEAVLGVSRPPYRSWTWTGLGARVGGPQMLRLPDGRIVVGARLYEPNQHTGLCWLDLEQKKLTEFLGLPSEGDSSYPGLVFHDGLLYVSYYSSHQGKANIYLAKVKLPPLNGGKARRPAFLSEVPSTFR